MGRPRLQPGATGNVTISGTRGNYVARCYVCTNFGERKRLRASGPTKEAARNALMKRARDAIGLGGGTLTTNSTIADVWDAWWPTIENDPDLRPQTIAQYKHHADRIRHDLADLEIRHATAGRLNAYIADAARDPNTGTTRRSVAKSLKIQLVSMCGWAVRRDLLPHNPARDIDIPAAKKAPVTALTPRQVADFRAHVTAWAADHPRSDTPLADIVDVMLGTGTRISEVLALRWSDIDLAATPATATISGTLVMVDGQLVRQEVPKSDAGYRVVSLPPFVTATLMELRMNARRDDIVFPSGAGTWRHPHNVRRTLRECRGETWKWVTPHILRKTVATAIYAEMDGKDAAGQLGHVDTAVTLRHYVKRAHVGPDATVVLQGLVSTPPTEGQGGSSDVNGP